MLIFDDFCICMYIHICTSLSLLLLSLFIIVIIILCGTYVILCRFYVDCRLGYHVVSFWDRVISQNLIEHYKHFVWPLYLYQESTRQAVVIDFKMATHTQIKISQIRNLGGFIDEEFSWGWLQVPKWRSSGRGWCLLHSTHQGHERPRCWSTWKVINMFGHVMSFLSTDWGPQVWLIFQFWTLESLEETVSADGSAFVR